MRVFTHVAPCVAQKSVKPLHVQSRSQTPHAPLVDPLLPLLLVLEEEDDVEDDDVPEEPEEPDDEPEEPDDELADEEAAPEEEEEEEAPEDEPDAPEEADEEDEDDDDDDEDFFGGSKPVSPDAGRDALVSEPVPSLGVVGPTSPSAAPAAHAIARRLALRPMMMMLVLRTLRLTPVR